VNKVVYVRAKFKETGKYEDVETPTGEFKKGFFGGEKEITKKVKQWIPTGVSDKEIDGVALATDISKAIAELNEEGYIVSAISNVLSGNYSWRYEEAGKNLLNNAPLGGGGYGYGYGYSYTEGVIIIATQSIV